MGVGGNEMRGGGFLAYLDGLKRAVDDCRGRQRNSATAGA